MTGMSSMLDCLICRRMGLPTEGLPTTHELRAQEDSALQQALAESAAAAGPVTAQAPAGPSSGPESVPEAAPETASAPEPEAAPLMSDEPAGGEAGVLAAPAPAAAPADAETVPLQLGGAEPAKRAKVRGTLHGLSWQANLLPSLQQTLYVELFSISEYAHAEP